MSKELDRKVEAELKKLAEGSFATQELINRISEVMDKVRTLLEKQEPDQALEGLETLDKSFKDKLERLDIATKPLETHATILAAYQNSRLTKELVRQNRLLTIFTGVLALATFLLFLATLVAPFLR
jgi:hypothetical protein